MAVYNMPRENVLQLAVVLEDDGLLLAAAENKKSRSTYNSETLLFDLENQTDGENKAMFRFSKEEIFRLAEALRVPDKIVLRNRGVTNGVEATCVLLRRLAYPNRLCDLEGVFGRPASTLSLIFTYMVDHLCTTFGHLLSNLNQPWLDAQHIQTYAEAVEAKGAPLSHCWGFLDGTVRPICRPVQFQRVCYNGHKRVHALKFQSIMLPNGLIGNLFGPVEGRRHDCALLRMSGLLPQLQALDFTDQDGNPYYLYGDTAYPIRRCLIKPFKGANLTEEQVEFNRGMSSVRECVEWGFGNIVQEFAFLDFKKNLKVFLQPVANMYLVGALLTNCHTCIYGNTTSMFFQCNPPSLEEYLRPAPLLHVM